MGWGWASALTPTTKKVALAPWRSSWSNTAGVYSGSGPSSNDRATIGLLVRAWNRASGWIRRRLEVVSVTSSLRAAAAWGDRPASMTAPAAPAHAMQPMNVLLERSPSPTAAITPGTTAAAQSHWRKWFENDPFGRPVLVTSDAGR